MNGSHDLTTMHWTPRLIALTAIGNPDIDGGKPQPCYIDPYSIKLITRGFTSWSKRIEDSGQKPEPPAHPQVECTVIWGQNGSLPVIESPAEVARLHDIAVGHEPPKPRAVQP